MHREDSGEKPSGILRLLGLSRALHFRWRERRSRGELEDRHPQPVDLYQALPEEKEAVKQYALDHPQDGYRRLACMMVDEDAAYLSPSSVYRILDQFDLLCWWKLLRLVGAHEVVNPEREFGERYANRLVYEHVVGELPWGRIWCSPSCALPTRSWGARSPS